MSNTAKFWIGVVLALPVVIVGSIVVGIASGIGSALDDTGHRLGRSSEAWRAWLELAAVVVALVLREDTVVRPRGDRRASPS